MPTNKIISRAISLINRAHKHNQGKDSAIHRAEKFIKSFELSCKVIDRVYDTVYDYADTLYEYGQQTARISIN